MAGERVRHQLETIRQHLMLLKQSVDPHLDHAPALLNHVSALERAIGELTTAVEDDFAEPARMLQAHQEELREHQRMFSTLVGNLPGLVYRCRNDPVWTTLFVSEGSLSLTGYRPEQFIDSRDLAYGDIIHPDDREAVWAEVQEALAQNRPFQMVYRIRTAEGEEKWVSEQGQATRLDNGEEVVEGFVADVTAERRAQEELRAREQLFSTLVQHSSDVISISDSAGLITYVSPSIERVLGYRPEELIGRPILQLAHPDDQERLLQEMTHTASTPGSLITTTFRYQHKDGSWRVMESVGTNQIDSPLIGGIVGNSRDITDRIQLEGQILQAHKMESVGRLAAGLAHDFNNVLTVISGFAEMINTSLAPNDAARGDVEQIMQAAERGSMLTNQLLTFARKRPIASQLLDLNTVIVEMEPLLRRLAGSSVSMSLQLASNLASVKADRLQLEQVLMNLVVNAADAMPQGGQLTIGTSNCESEHEAQVVGLSAPHCVRLSVRDTGLGIPPDVQQQIFDPFFTTKEARGGTGLGLSISYGIIKEHGGTIAVESSSGRGTIFHLYLPQAESKTGSPRHEEVERATMTGERLILVVEDEESLRGLLVRILRGHGYRVCEAGHGKEALAVGQFGTPQAPDLLVTDIMMPEISGKELVQKVRVISPDAKVLFVSAYGADLGDLLNTRTRFLQKPFTPAELLRMVREMLESS